MRFSCKYIIGILCCLLIQFSIRGQVEEEDLVPDGNYSEFWIDLTLNKPLNEKWTLGGDLGLRSALNNSNWTLFYLRPNINYKLFPIFDLTFGLGSFNTFNREIDNTYEFRVYQDGNLHWPKLGIFNFSHRIRLEERFFSFGSDELENQFSFRGRYMISTRTDPFALGKKKDWTAFLSLEPFFPLGKEVNELLASNFRWDAALSYQVSENLRIELHYILQTSEIFSNNDQKIKENIFRFRVFQKL